MGLILNLTNLAKKLEQIRDIQTVGLVTGCFDLLHPDHIDFLRFAKRNVNLLIVGVDNNLSIKSTKGASRPINTQEDRAIVLSELTCVDYVLLLENPCSFENQYTNEYHNNIVDILRPNYLITNKRVDKYWVEKKKRIEKVGGTLVLYKGKAKHSTTKIIEKLIENHSGEFLLSELI